MPAIDVTFEGRCATIRLSRPEVLNAIDMAIFEGLPGAVSRVADSDAAVCVVTGEGRAFSSGIDMNTLATQTGEPAALIATAQAGYRALATLPLPTIASIQGYALGAGLQLALACDLRIAARDAVLGLLELDFGIVPDLGGSTALPRLVGRGRAKRMIWLRERITAEEAERIGLVEFVVDPEQLGDATERLVGKLASTSPVAVAESKALIDAGPGLDAEAGMDAEAESQIRCMTDPGFADALMRGVQARVGSG